MSALCHKRTFAAAMLPSGLRRLGALLGQRTLNKLRAALPGLQPPLTSTASVPTLILGQFDLAVVSASRESVRQTLVRVRAAATGALVFPGAASDLECVLLEVRTLLPALV